MPILFTYGEYKLAANNLFKTKKTNFFKRAKLASKNTQRELFEKRKILYVLKFEQCQILSSISVLHT